MKQSLIRSECLCKSLFIITAICLMLAIPSQAPAQNQTRFTISSTAFAPNGQIPKQYTCKNPAAGSPPLRWSNVPAGTKTLALIIKDPDAPRGTFIHWVIYNIPATAAGLRAGIPRRAKLANGTMQGDNTLGRIGYMGPCPPPGPAHHYHFQLMALDTRLDIEPGATAAEIEAASRGKIKGETELVATFGR